MTTTFHIVAQVEAADMAIRFAKDRGMLPYAIYYDSGSRLD